MISECFQCEVMAYEQLTADSVVALVDGSIGLVRIPEFCPEVQRDAAVKRLTGHSDRGYYNKAEAVGRLGIAHFEIDSAATLEKYYDKATSSIRELRKIFSPYLSPMDHLRLLLEEVWPAGAILQKIEEKNCFVGITRILDPTGDLLPHTDRFDREYDSNICTDLMGQLSASIYLQVPEQGGELELWSIELTEEEELNLRGDSYGIDREALAAPQLTFQPRDGDLLIFNTRMLHAVRPGVGTTRVSLGAFIGYWGKDRPLTYWS